MRLNRPRRSRRLMNLTPLIDVVFLLLVFFMLASTFLEFGTVKLEAAGSGEGQSVDPKGLALIHVAGGGRYRVDGQPVTPETFAGALGDVVARGKRDAVIVVGRGAKVGDLVSGLSIVRGQGFQSVRVVE